MFEECSMWPCAVRGRARRGHQKGFAAPRRATYSRALAPPHLHKAHLLQTPCPRCSWRRLLVRECCEPSSVLGHGSPGSHGDTGRASGARAA